MTPWRALASLAAAVVVAVAPTLAAGAQAPDPGSGDSATVTTAPPVTGDASEVIHSWALAPAADESGAGGNRPNLSYTGDPGTVIEDQVTLYNYGNQQLTFRIYATDAFTNDGGQFDILPSDEAPTGVGAWVSIPQEFVQVPPGQQVTMPITVTIPQGADPGDHAGAVVAASQALSSGEGGNVVSVERRTGTRLYLRVNGPLQPELAIVGLTTHYSPSANPFGGKATVTYTVENRGNVRLAGASTVAVTAPFGLAEKSVPPTELAELLPGGSTEVTVEVDGVPAFGLVSTEVTVEPIVIGEGVDVAPVSRSTTTFAPPVLLLLVGLVTVFIVLAVRAVRRNRSRTQPVPARQLTVTRQP